MTSEVAMREPFRVGRGLRAVVYGFGFSPACITSLRPQRFPAQPHLRREARSKLSSPSVRRHLPFWAAPLRTTYAQVVPSAVHFVAHVRRVRFRAHNGVDHGRSRRATTTALWSDAL